LSSLERLTLVVLLAKKRNAGKAAQDLPREYYARTHARIRRRPLRPRFESWPAAVLAAAPF